MPVVPLVQFKAGICEVDDSSKPWKIKPLATPGFIYLYKEEDLAHFCWRPRTASLDDIGEDSLDLIMFPGDGHFEPWQPADENHARSTQVVNGRIYRLGFQSSSAKHFFWLQSKADSANEGPSQWSDRDYMLGRIVGEILNGENVNARDLYDQVGRQRSTHPDDDDDDTDMRDTDDGGNDHSGTGGAGSGATGGDVTEEGEESRQGGEDGARATPSHLSTSIITERDAQTAVADLLRSLQSNPMPSQPRDSGTLQEKAFTTLPELLSQDATLDLISSAQASLLDDFLLELPAQLLASASDVSSIGIDSHVQLHDLAKLGTEQKRKVVDRVVRSPQFAQSLASLTVALREGGLPTISDALQVEVERGGFAGQGLVPLGGGEAIEAFLKGVRKLVQKELKSGNETESTPAAIARR